MTRPVPILLMSRELGPGGTERQLAEVARHLDRSRFEPHVGCFHFEGMRADELRAAGIPVVPFAVRSFVAPGTLAAAVSMARYLALHRIRIVHTFDAPLNMFGVPVARCCRVPLVISSQRCYRSLFSPAYQSLLRLTDRMVDAVVVNCEAMREHLLHDEKVPAGLVRLCYNGIDTTVFHPGPKQFPDPRLRDHVVIGGVYALRPEKALDTLLDAFARIRPRQLRIKLLIVGSGPSEKELRRRASALGIAEDCHFEPAAQNVADWLRAIDIFVLPSISEALSNSLMEAMACGCSAVATQVGGNPELVREGESGLLFPPGDAAALARNLEMLIGSEDLRRRFGAHAWNRIHREFTVEASACRMQEIYTSLLEN